VLPTQTLNPLIINQFLELHESLLRRRFAEPKMSPKSAGGRPRVGPLWVLVALCFFSRMEGIPWRQLPAKLSSCHFLMENGYLSHIPSWQKFHQVWNLQVNQRSLENLISSIGNEIAKPTATAVAVDSSGFQFFEGSTWRYLKWAAGQLKKTSTMFRKIHIAVEVSSRAIVAICPSKSKDHDAVIFARIWRRLSKRLLSKIRRFYADKAYWSENILGLIAQNGITPVIPPKKNSVDHGTSDPMDLIVRARNNYPGLYRINHKPQLRSTVEHTFGNVTQAMPRITDRKAVSRAKALLTPFLWYNHSLLVQSLEVKKMSF